VRFPTKVVNMAKRKADELEDFTGKLEPNSGVGVKKEDVEEGSALLKELLGRWKQECEGQGLSGEEMVGKMRELVLADRKLSENPFFKSVKAL
jgi:DNA mismatch repair protein MSH2